MDGGESVSDVCGVINGQSGRQYDDDGRSDLDGQSPIIHQSQQVDQGECDAGEHPKDGHQIGDKDQSDGDDRSHRQAQVTNQLVANHLCCEKKSHSSQFLRYHVLPISNVENNCFCCNKNISSQKINWYWVDAPFSI